jgi:DNA-binding MarR family transcriptional regulator
MNLDKVLSRFVAVPHDQAELRRLARSLGNELPRERLDVLGSFRAGLARAPVFEGAADGLHIDSYAMGYVASMLDVIAEYETGLRQRRDQEALEELALREGWRDVLLALREGPRRIAELGVMLGEQRDHIARVLSELCAAGLVRTPGRDALDRRARRYRLTVDGERVAEAVDRGLPDGVARGIRIAVRLLQHVLVSASSPADALETIAEELLLDPRAAAEAVSVWAEEAMDAGLIGEREVRETVRVSDSVPEPLWARGSQPVVAPMAEQHAAGTVHGPCVTPQQIHGLGGQVHIEPVRLSAQAPVYVPGQLPDLGSRPPQGSIPLFAANDNDDVVERFIRIARTDDDPDDTM